MLKLLFDYFVKTLWNWHWEWLFEIGYRRNLFICTCRVFVKLCCCNHKFDFLVCLPYPPVCILMFVYMNAASRIIWMRFFSIPLIFYELYNLVFNGVGREMKWLFFSLHARNCFSCFCWCSSYRKSTCQYNFNENIPGKLAQKPIFGIHCFRQQKPNYL